MDCRTRRALEQAQKAGEKLAKDMGELRSKRAAGQWAREGVARACCSPRPAGWMPLPTTRVLQRWMAGWLTGEGHVLGVWVVGGSDESAEVSALRSEVTELQARLEAAYKDAGHNSALLQDKVGRAGKQKTRRRPGHACMLPSFQPHSWPSQCEQGHSTGPTYRRRLRSCCVWSAPQLTMLEKEAASQRAAHDAALSEARSSSDKALAELRQSLQQSAQASGNQKVRGEAVGAADA